MALIGTLDDIVFECSDSKVYTVTSMTWSGKASIATTTRHNTDALTEFTGLEPDEIQLSISLCSWLGPDPMEELVKIWTYMREGRALPLTLGDHAYGRYRWLITDHSDEARHFDKAGNLYSVDVTITLIEYLRD